MVQAIDSWSNSTLQIVKLRMYSTVQSNGYVQQLNSLWSNEAFIWIIIEEEEVYSTRIHNDHEEISYERS